MKRHPIKDQTLFPDIVREADTLMPPQTTVLWKASGETGEWERILTDMRTMVEDENMAWSQANIIRFKEIKRTLMQRLMKTEIPHTVSGPEGREMLEIEKDTRSNFVVWMKNAQLTIDDEINQRWQNREGIQKIGTSAALLRGITPLQEKAQSVNYFPGNNLLSEEQARNVYTQGISHVLGQVSGLSKQGEHPGCEFIRDIREFRKSRARWAEIRGNALIALEDGNRSDAWFIVVPHDHPKMQEPHTLRVDRFSDGHALYINPYDMTPEWAGILGIHELRHLYDFATGIEPSRPNRQEYIEGEVRAYTAELAAADIYSKGRLASALDEVISRLNLNSENIPALMSDIDTMTAISINLDSFITSELPRSNAESNMRAGFYIFALAFREAEKKTSDELERLGSMRRVVETIYGAQGQLPKE